MIDNKMMQSILSFFAEHSPSIIKLLSIIVALAASVLLYRVIFVQNVEAVQQTSTGDLTDFNRKINEQKIEIDTLISASEATKAELEKQRTEIYNLRQTIKEKDTEIETVKAECQQLKLQMGETKKLDYEKHQSEVILSTADENLVFQKEIAELKRRLSDYEIIAEDISDMQRLKDENEKLKQMIGNTPEAPNVEPAGEALNENPSESPNESDLDQVLAEMNQSQAAPTKPSADIDEVVEFKNPSANAPGDLVPNEKSSIETEVLGPGPGVNIETETLEGVSDVDKNLLDKFEKQKET